MVIGVLKTASSDTLELSPNLSRLREGREGGRERGEKEGGREGKGGRRREGRGRGRKGGGVVGCGLRVWLTLPVL